MLVAIQIIVLKAFYSCWSFSTQMVLPFFLSYWTSGSYLNIVISLQNLGVILA